MTKDYAPLHAVLNPSHGVEVWINQTMAQTIEDGLKAYLGTDEVNYYYVACRARERGLNCDEMENPHPIVWFGAGLVPFIRKAHARAPEAFALMATSAHSKGGIRHDREGDEDNVYWLGDADSTGLALMCGSNMFVMLWNRLRDGAARKEK